MRFEERAFEKEGNPTLASKPSQLLVPLNTGGGDKLLQMVCGRWGQQGAWDGEEEDGMG